MSSKISTIMATKKPSQTKTKKVPAAKKTSAPLSKFIEEKKNTPIIIEKKLKIDNSTFWWSFEEKKASQRGLLWYVGIGVLITALIIFAL